MNVLTHLDICSGGAGFALAAGWAGFRTIGFAEIEPFPCYVLSELFPGVPNHGDLRRITADAIGAAVTLLTGGIPCQPASQAGKGLGSADPRWLWDEAISLLGRVRPRYAVFENPAGILTVRGADRELEFPRIVAGLRGAGYHVWWQDLSAAEIGASHERNRIWIVCVRMDDATRNGDGGQVGQAFLGRGVCGTGDEGYGEPISYAGGPQSRREPAGGEEEAGRPHSESGGPSRTSELADSEDGLASTGYSSGTEANVARFGICGQAMADSAQGIRLGSREQGRCEPALGSEAVANSIGAGSQGFTPFGFPRSHDGYSGRSGGEDLPQHPPGPDDLDGWRAVLGVAPWLAPAVEPGVCWVVDGLSLPVDCSRAAVLSLLGNAIHPETVYPLLQAIAETELNFED